MTEDTNPMLKTTTYDASAHYRLLATRCQQEGLIAERDAWRERAQALYTKAETDVAAWRALLEARAADLETAQSQHTADTDYIERLRKWIVDDVRIVAEMRENLDNADAWANHYQERAERKAAKARRLKAEVAVLNGEMARMGNELDAERQLARENCARRGEADAACDYLAAELKESKALARKHFALFQEQVAVSDDLRAENARLQADLDEAMRLYRKAQADLTAINAAWHAERAAGLRLDGAPADTEQSQ